MNLQNLSPAIGSNKENGKRLGRGEASGKGGTSSRGHKGAKSRSGYSKKIGFEGGQMPLQRRIPKFGFKNINRVSYRVINISKIQELIKDKKVKKELSVDLLVDLRLAHKNDLVKILGNGKIDSPIKITAHKFSASAKAAIEAAGGEVVKL
ncbi:MAG: 50S ribosomal protein L15 [Flavobacteriaceae bacterium]|nr:50S ribosomal protein L15 [Flavobacteriaceae bacterium]|tara:strand:+ start:1498 stop:1950 length:453 start_codon:yes stop_codon:yes gene_type:complete